MSIAPYPVQVNATLDPGMSRWLWLVKWLLAVPHYFVLFFLWVAFAATSVIAFFAILVSGRYPLGLFDFNVGVLRWSWRVAFYAYGALGTDRYPPFTLADVPDYPAHLEVEYPRRLSRGLVLVKWWLLAIPHYLVVGIFVGGGTWALWRTVDPPTQFVPGLIGLLVLIAAVTLGFTGRYPRQLFDFILGMNRWALRVAAYAGLMTDQYPPFRLDMGGHEPGGAVTVPSPTITTPAPSTRRGGWTAGRVVSLVIGAVLGLISLGFLGAGGIAAWATNTQRDHTGYLTSGARSFTTASYALTSDTIDFGGSADWVTPGDILGTLRIRATPKDPARSVFIGVGPEAGVNSYLGRIGHLVVTNWADGNAHVERGTGGAPLAKPADVHIWTVHAEGTGTQTVTWQPTSGHWIVVVMNEDASAGVSVNADAGATIPDLGWIAAALFAAGAIVLLIGIVLIAVPLARVSR